MIRSKRAPGVKLITGINITPFTDVCLVLLIIFMVTATALTKETSLNLNLPKASTPKQPLPTSVTVRITHEQQVYVNKDQVTFATLQDRLSQLRARLNTNTLVVKADEGVPYRLVIQTIDLARQVGLDQISLATRQPDASDVAQP